jgi:hypothetical protein
MNCVACLHRDRDLLDAQLVAGVPYRAIANTFDLSLGSISRHRRHLVDMVKERTTSERGEHAGVLLNRVESLLDEAKGILADAKAAKDLRAGTNAVHAVARVLELIGKLTGELAQPNMPGLHLTLNRVTNNAIVAVDNDTDFAAMVGEATKGFSVDELMRLKALVCNTRDTPLLMR